MRIDRRIVLVIAAVFALTAAPAFSYAQPIQGHGDQSPPTSQAELWMAEGRRAFEWGKFEEAAQHWTEAARLYRAAGSPDEESEALARRAEGYQALGQLQLALDDLRHALALAERGGERLRTASIKSSLGSAYLLLGEKARAREYLTASIAQAREAGSTRVVAAGLNNLGNLLTSEGKHGEALAAFEESARLAEQDGDHLLAAKAWLNAANATLQQGNPEKVKGWLDAAWIAIDGLGDSHDKAYALIVIGQLYRRLPPSIPAQVRLRRAQEAFDQATRIAEAIQDPRASAYALGYLGQLYEEERRPQEALRLTRRAAFAAQQANAPEILYLWQWQIGRLLKAQGDTEGAISAYRQAVYNLESVRYDLSVAAWGGRTSFREAIEPVFFELADLLLQRAPSLPDQAQAEALRIEAREAVEQLKAAELRDYFQDDCVIALQSKAIRLDRLGGRAAAIYPILLADRTELLLSLPKGMKQMTVPTAAEAITQEVRLLRKRLEKRTTHEYLPHAQRLYDWLIRPIEAELVRERIDTLIFVPGGALRTIPMAALHDGEQFLIDKYAVASTPGLMLTDPHPLRRKEIQLLLAGLTESVQGFPPLAHVSSEIESIHGLYGGTVLQDREFRVPKVKEELAEVPYSILHIASHGKFESDPQKTFLLTFDDRLTMNRLEQFIGVARYREDPIELLTLSACQTAAGDDRAALGLAGVAIKAGARSALATLWLINDEASSLLVSEFYHQLKDPSLSKAKALQRAQRKLLHDRRYRHPGYWSPFLLLGNWL
jgi:CHAT domain-containing protein